MRQREIGSPEMPAYHEYTRDESPPVAPAPDTLKHSGESFVESLKDSQIFIFLQYLVSTYCPWLSSSDTLKKNLHTVLTNIKERPATTILYGLIIVFGFLPFAGFILLVCGSFAILFTWFIFCQFIAVVISALVCTGVFWAMLGGFAVLAMLLGGAVHSLLLWGVLAKHAARLVNSFSTRMLKILGIPDANLHHSPD